MDIGFAGLWVEEWLRDNIIARMFREAAVQVGDFLVLQVRDTAGRHFGTVVDVRLVLDGDPGSRPGDARLFGLVVSPRTRSSYLGFGRSDASRPFMLAALLRWRHRGTFLALWQDIARVGPHTVESRAGFTRYSSILGSDD